MKRTLISVKGRTRLLEKKVNAVLEKTTIELPDKDKIVIEWETITDSSGQKKTNWYSVIATRYKDGVIQDTLTDVPAAYLKFFVEREGYDVYTRELPIQKDHRERYYDKIKSFLGEYAWYFNYAKGTHPRFSRKPNNEKNEHGTSGASENVSENKPETSSSDPHKSADGLSSKESTQDDNDIMLIHKGESSASRFYDSYHSSHGAKLKSSQLYLRPHFVREARVNVFYELDDSFRKSHVVFLYGMGGIGKSEAAKQWAKMRSTDFDTIVFAQLGKKSNIRQLIIDDTVFVIDGDFFTRGDFFLSTRKEESDDAYYLRKLAKIKQISNSRTLIIIDNYNISDNFLMDLLDGEYNLLVTTRNIYEGHEFPVVEVREIEDIELLKKVFLLNLEGRRNDIRIDDPWLERLIQLVLRHTLAIEILAKSLVHSIDTLQTLYEKLNSRRGISFANVDSKVRRSLTDEKITPFDIILGIFDISMLKSDPDYDYKVQVLAFMAAMPTKGVEEWLIKKWCDNNAFDALNNLIDRSWLRRDTINDATIISMHPLVREVVWHELQPSLEKCGLFEEKFTYDDMGYLNELYHKPIKIKEQYFKVAESLLAYFPIEDTRHLPFYFRLQRIFHTCKKIRYAKSLAESICEILVKEGRQESWEYGYVQYRIGAVYTTLLRRNDMGYPYLERAKKIMVSCSKTDLEKMWLFFLYREYIFSIYRDIFSDSENKVFDSPRLIEDYINKCKSITYELEKNGFNDKNIQIFLGSSYVWLSKMQLYYGHIDLSKQLIQKAEEVFLKFNYINQVDKVSVLDVKANIYRECGCFSEQVKCLMEASKLFLASFGESNIYYIETAKDIAVALISAGKKDKAKAVLLRCLEIVQGIIQDETVNLEDSPVIKSIRLLLVSLDV